MILAPSIPERVVARAVATALTMLFLTPATVADPYKGCGARYHAATDAGPRSQCRTKSPNVFSRPPPRIALGIGDVVSVTIFEPEPGGLFIPNDPGGLLLRGAHRHGASSA
jgi:hypothetical protein